MTTLTAGLPWKTRNALMLIAYCFLTEDSRAYYLAKRVRLPQAAVQTYDSGISRHGEKNHPAGR